jgi:hypothetical protein
MNERYGIKQSSRLDQSRPGNSLSQQPDGVARCTRYAFGPNKLHLCGPDLNQEVLAYIKEGISDEGLTNIIKRFETLYPYLQQIALANSIKDPFDPHVVEAYWIGNELLDTIPAKTYYRHLKDSLQIQKRSPSKQMDQLKDKLTQGALMHHSFHVLNVWRRTGHNGTNHTIDTFDKCIISWSQVKSIDGPIITTMRQPLTLKAGKLAMGPPRPFKFVRPLEASSTLDNIKTGDIVTIHWNSPCEIINKRQLINLKKYTKMSINLANQTI